MRTIKFRMWSKEVKKFFYDADNVYDCLKMFQTPRLRHFYQDTVWQQFTGLFDNGGQEIYEGDLVKFSEEDRPFEVRYCIDTEGCYYGLIDPEDSGFGYKLSNDRVYEVVGNIFEK